MALFWNISSKLHHSCSPERLELVRLLFYLFILIPQTGSTTTNSHKRAGLTQQKFIGVQVAFLAKTYRGLTSKGGLSSFCRLSQFETEEQD